MKQIFPPNLLAPRVAAYPMEDFTQLDQVNEDTADFPFPGVMVPPQNPQSSLAQLRAQYPFVPIMPFPQSAQSAIVLAANVAADINVPSEAMLGMFLSSGDFYVSKDGRAYVPGAAGADNTSIYRPVNMWFYVGNTTQFSVVAPLAGTVVQLVTLSPNVGVPGMNL